MIPAFYPIQSNRYGMETASIRTSPPSTQIQSNRYGMETHTCSGWPWELDSIETIRNGNCSPLFRSSDASTIQSNRYGMETRPRSLGGTPRPRIQSNRYGMETLPGTFSISSSDSIEPIRNGNQGKYYSPYTQNRFNRTDTEWKHPPDIRRRSIS